MEIQQAIRFTINFTDGHHTYVILTIDDQHHQFWIDRAIYDGIQSDDDILHYNLSAISIEEALKQINIAWKGSWPEIRT